MHREASTLQTMKILLTFVLLSCAGCSIIDTGDDGPPLRVIPMNELRDVRTDKNDLIGKTPTEILSAVGAPDRQAANTDREWWTYENRFRDPLTEKRVQFVTFFFAKGKLVDVTF